MLKSKGFYVLRLYFYPKLAALSQFELMVSYKSPIVTYYNNVQHAYVSWPFKFIPEIYMENSQVLCNFYRTREYINSLRQKFSHNSIVQFFAQVKADFSNEFIVIVEMSEPLCKSTQLKSVERTKQKDDEVDEMKTKKSTRQCSTCK